MDVADDPADALRRAEGRAGPVATLRRLSRPESVGPAAYGGQRIEAERVRRSRGNIAACAIPYARTGGGPRHQGTTSLPVPPHSSRATVPIGGQPCPDDESFDAAAWFGLAYRSRGSAVTGGSSVIQRNILPERMLGLPRS